MIIDGSSYEICNDDRFGSILVWLMDKIVKIYKVLIAKLMRSQSIIHVYKVTYIAQVGDCWSKIKYMG